MLWQIALTAGQGEAEVKPSGILINQLMSLATVASMLLTVVAQTDDLEQIRRSAFHTALRVVQDFSDMASGQATFEDSSSGMSSICLLRYIGFEGQLWQAHLLHSLVPAVLVLSLALRLEAKNRPLAVVVGMNCFWPEIFSFFGKHLYCYQVMLDAYECPFAPDYEGRKALRVLTACVTVGAAGWWIWLSLPEKGRMSLHQLYLTKPYRSGVALWESERLLRKTALTMAVSALPITSSPALQLACIGSIIVVSLILYVALLPYKSVRWNLTECALLLTAVFMTVLVFGVTAYNSFWGHVAAVEYAMIAATIALAGSVCLVMTYFIYKELCKEWYRHSHLGMEQSFSEAHDSLLWLKFL